MMAMDLKSTSNGRFLGSRDRSLKLAMNSPFNIEVSLKTAKFSIQATNVTDLFLLYSVRMQLSSAGKKGLA